MGTVIEIAKKAKEALGPLLRLSTQEKNQILLSMAKRIALHQEAILTANKKDLAAAKTEVEQGKMAESLYHRLKLDEAKLKDIMAGIEQVASLDDPVGKITLATEMDEGLELYRVTCPLGVVGVIFEARPDALTQIASLCLKSSNAVILKGGKEAEHSNRALFTILHEAAIEGGVPSEALALLETREEVKDLLKADRYVDLIIPRGSNALVRFIQQNTSIPVLGHADGICHVYVDEAADLKKALDVCVDSKVQYPSACNAVETILIHRQSAAQFVPMLLSELKAHGVESRCDEEMIRHLKLNGTPKAVEEDWKTEYGDLIVSIKMVNDLDEAIAHINTYGSHHTEAIVTKNEKTFDRFFAEVESAGVYWNVSTRFADGFRYGFGAEVGISTGKLHPRGPVGLDGLVTYKYKIVGNGQTVSLYSGPKAKRFVHKPLKATTAK